MRYVRLLRRGPVLLLWGAQTTSVFGDRLYAMAVMWMAWEHAGAGVMGLVAVAESLPYVVLGTLGRRVMDWFASLLALAVVDAVRLVLVAALPWAWAEFGTVGLITSAALLGVGGALFDPNLGAMVPDLVRPDEVQAVSGLMDLTGRISRVAGPGAAGLLLAVMPLAGLFWVDAATFAVSALALVLLAASVRPGAAAPQAGLQPAGTQPGAWSLVRTHPDTGVVLAVHGIGIFAGAVSLAMPALLAAHLDAGASAYAAVLACTGAGALAGNLAAGNVRLPAPLTAVYCAAWAVSGLVLAATGLAGSLPVLLTLSVLSGAVSPFLQIALSTHFALFPPAARRRLLTVDLTVIRTCGTVSMLFVPALAATGPRVAFLVGGLVVTVVGWAGAVLVLALARGRRPLPEVEPVPELAARD
ncbi:MULTISPECIES: MFS transporter [Kitasatospora]|uniref:MFS transporter n=1 Tax=Kitasatospora cathayae TaxID=3004092 RepID=A0ABY7Q9B3_9ACTN|nr:MFS transporter [Kitasatospora sp. HUAS 3-15]WBP89328.1 MFS transporter [Kitasatospora sp. HUAS 3-15]